MIPFPPVVEHEHEGAFITRHPRDEVAPHALSMPWIIGLTSDEGAMKSAAFAESPKLMADLNENWDKAWPLMLYYDHHPKDKQRQITQAITEFYFNNERRVGPATLQNFTNVRHFSGSSNRCVTHPAIYLPNFQAVTDGWFWHGIENYLRIRLEKNAKVGPTYVYLFTHKSAASFTELFKGGRENYYGVCHAEELQSLFPIAPSLFVSAVPTKEDLEMRRALTKIWTDFARTG